MLKFDAGEYQRVRAALACMKAYVDASDGELERWGVSRDDCLALAREYIGPSSCDDASLATMFERIVTAFKLGKAR